MFPRCLPLSCLLVASCLVAQDTSPEKLPRESGGEPATELAAPAELETFLILPLRMIRLRSESFAAANCALQDQDCERILTKVNRVWAVAGICFGLEAIDEAPANVEQFQRGFQRREPNANEAADDAWLHDRTSASFRDLIPAIPCEFAGFRVYYIQEFDVNGIYYGRREAMVKATARLKPVPGGIDEPLPRVTAHELGHGLGLAHRQDRLNLMASGTTGTSFIREEVEQARAVALKIPGVIRYADLPDLLSQETNAERKALLERWRQAAQVQATPRDSD